MGVRHYPQEPGQTVEIACLSEVRELTRFFGAKHDWPPGVRSPFRSSQGLRSEPGPENTQPYGAGARAGV